jgi:hypothetical protein
MRYLPLGSSETWFLSTRRAKHNLKFAVYKNRESTFRTIYISKGSSINKMGGTHSHFQGSDNTDRQDKGSPLIDENQGTGTQEQEDADNIINDSLLAARECKSKRKKSFDDIVPSFMFMHHDIAVPVLAGAGFAAYFCGDDDKKKYLAPILGIFATLQKFWSHRQD